MKTLKILIVLCCIAAFAANNVKAQNGFVIKETVSSVCPPFQFCTGEYLCGNITYVEFDNRNGKGWVEKVRDGYLIGYEDAAHTKVTGNVYELLQTDNGKNDWSSAEQTVLIKLHGKVVAIQRWHTQKTTNANGTVTVEFTNSSFECK